MAKFNFYLRDSNAKSETPIVLFVYHQSRFKIPTGKTIHPKLWNPGSQSVRAGADNAKKINQFLKALKAQAENCLHSLELELGRAASAKELKEAIIENLEPNDAINAANAIDKKPNFFELFARFIEESETGDRLSDTGKRLSPLSIKKYKTTETRLTEFSQKYNLDFDTIDQNFYKKFLLFLNHHGYKPNTIGKYVQVIKTFMKYAMENGYTTNTEFQKRTFKAFSETGFSIYLTEDEINDLWNLDLKNNQRLEPVRDLFIVGCYTGLRYSDVSRLNKSHLEDGFFKIKTHKTKQTVIIPVHATVKAIMDKYDGIPKAISNQKTNQYLKEITAMAPSLQRVVEIEQVEGGETIIKMIPKFQLVTTHTARRSFATNLYKSGKMTAWDIMQITGHKTEQAFLKYIKVTPEESAERLRQIWQKDLKLTKT